MSGEKFTLVFGAFFRAVISFTFCLTWCLLSGHTEALVIPFCFHLAVSQLSFSSCRVAPSSAFCFLCFVRVHSWWLLIFFALDCCLLVDICIDLCISLFVVSYCSTFTSFGGFALTISETIFPPLSLPSIYSLPLSARELAVIGYCF